MPCFRPVPVAPALLLALLTSACLAPRHVDDGPITIIHNGDRVVDPTRATDAATARALEERVAGRAAVDSLTAAAYASCAPALCAALGRGELALGMTEAQLLAATRTTAPAWSVRQSGTVAILAPRDADAPPHDAVAPVALVQLVDGAVASVTYREPQGFRTVRSAADASGAGRTRALALREQGDALAGAGDFTAALDRYDRASVVEQADAALQYRIATTLDKLLRPREAELRYRLFLHQLDLETIGARGAANARLAAAMVQARERLLVLEKR